MLTPHQLELVSDEYYVKGFVHGRNRLYDHLKSSYPDIFTSRDNIGEWFARRLFQWDLLWLLVSFLIQ